jgi:hypothetical protein
MNPIHLLLVYFSRARRAAYLANESARKTSITLFLPNHLAPPEKDKEH